MITKIPPALVAAVAVAVLHKYGVSFGDIAAFASYVALAVALPGTLVWRALTGGGRSFVEDVAAGTALGYAIEVLCYIPSRVMGAPRLVLMWPILTIALFLAVPALRRHWRGAAERPPAWWSWTVAAVVGFLIVWGGLVFFAAHGLTWPGNATPYVDMPYHLALAGEIKHHVPPTVPTVLGERLSYHWFVYADMAASGWVTGIEAQTLVYRLSVLPMVSAFVVLVAITAVRITGRWWAGPAALGLCYFVFTPALYVGAAEPFSPSSLYGIWVSPTQTFGALLFVPIVLLLAGLLRETRRGVAPWTLVAILLLAITGAKATYLPLLLAGLLLVFAVRLVADRRIHPPTVVALAMTGVCLLIAQFILFGRGTQGMSVSYLALTRRTWGVLTGLTGPAITEVGPTALLGLTAVYLLCWACLWAGVIGLAVRPRRLLDPPVLLLLGVGLAAVGVVLVFGHPAVGQLYFLTAARPYLSIAAVCGLVAVLGSRRARWAWIAGAGVTGAGLAATARAWLGVGLPVRGDHREQLLTLALPYIVVVAIVGLVAAVLFLVVSRRVAVAMVLVLITGLGVPPLVAGPLAPFLRLGTAAAGRASAVQLVPSGAIEAGHWLRDHSSPDDVVATNVHCLPSKSPRRCDSRDFWVAGYTERRVLVEGWAYTEPILSQARPFVSSYAALPFWDEQRLGDNDEVFRRPSRLALDRLRDKYGVRWLFIDNRRNEPSPKLSRFAALRFSSGSCAIYEIDAKKG